MDSICILRGKSTTQLGTEYWLSCQSVLTSEHEQLLAKYNDWDTELEPLCLDSLNHGAATPLRGPPKVSVRMLNEQGGVRWVAADVSITMLTLPEAISTSVKDFLALVDLREEWGQGILGYEDISL
jgi:hypothetical protein